MKFTPAEIIQVLRRRAGLNQSELGAKAFAVSVEAGRTRIKNIELGKQVPTYEDLRKIAPVLGVDIAALLSEGAGPTNPAGVSANGQELLLDSKVADLFPGLGEYLGILNKAVMLDDGELVAHSCRRIIDLLRSETTAAVRAVNQ